MAYFNPSNLLPNMSTPSAREIIGPIVVLLVLVLWSALEENAPRNLHSISPPIWETLDSFKRTNDVCIILSSTFSTISSSEGFSGSHKALSLCRNGGTCTCFSTRGKFYISNFGFGVWWKVTGLSSLRSCFHRYDSAIKLTENRVPSGYSQLYRSKHCLKIQSAHGASRQSSQFKEALWPIGVWFFFPHVGDLSGVAVDSSIIPIMDGRRAFLNLSA